MAGKFLSYLYENLDKDFQLKPRDYNWEAVGTLLKYDQHEFVHEKVAEDGFTDFGYVYYPNTCVATPEKKCKVHVFIHGCEESADINGDVSVRWNGFVEYAASNDIILVFPQNKSHNRVVGDDEQCWSHYKGAIEDENFVNHNGIQQSAYKRLFERLGAPREEQVQ